MAFFRSEGVEALIRAISQYLPDAWVAVDLDDDNVIELIHAHPRGCPNLYKIAEFNDGRGHIGKALKFHMKGKFKCENEDCMRKWSSARAMLVVIVQPHCRIARKRTATGWTAFSIEQGCHRCSRDTFADVYQDEALRIAEWLTDAYTHGEYPHEERKQRASHMRAAHDKSSCGACRLGLH